MARQAWTFFKLKSPWTIEQQIKSKHIGSGESLQLAGDLDTSYKNIIIFYLPRDLVGYNTAIDTVP